MCVYVIFIVLVSSAFYKDGKPCSPDKSPGSGTACEPYPSEVTVCGACGILYDSSYPVGVKMV